MVEESYKENYIRVQDDMQLYYREYGDIWSKKTPVLCLPGMTRNSKDFHNVASWMARDRWVICPDYRGRGKSDYDPNWKHYNAMTYIYDLMQLIIACNLKDIIVIGTSMGGLLSMGLNLVKPNLIKGLIINDIGPTIASNGLGRIVNYIGVDKPKRSLEEAIDHLRTLFPNMALLSRAEWIEFATNTFRKKEDGLYHYDWDVNIAKAIRAETGEMPDLWAMFRALKKIPLLVIHGEVSDILNIDTVKEMHAVHPQMTSITIPNVGHAPTLNEIESRKALDLFFQNIEQNETGLFKKVLSFSDKTASLFSI